MVIVKNAVANVVRGSSSALIALLLPPFLVHFLSIDEFNVWVLILQLSAYTSFLDFGVQTAVGRFVAHTTEMKERRSRDEVINTAFALLSISSALGIALIVFATWKLSNLFPRIPSSLNFDAQVSLLLVGISTAIGLPISVFSGVFIGLQRFEVPALIMGGGKLINGLLLIFIVRQYGSIVPMAVTYSCVNIFTYIMQIVAYLKINTKTKFSVKLISYKVVKELTEYCLSLSVWSFAMLLVIGLDTTLIGILDFNKLAYYGIAASLITFISGLQNAVFTSLMPAAAVLNAQGNSRQLGKLLIDSTRYGMYLLLLTGLTLVALSKILLSIWLGASFVENTSSILQILLLANIIRLSAIPYSTLLIGTGQQKLVILSPFLEGASNLLFSIFLGLKFGAIGVALGTLIGAIIGVIFHYLYNMKKTTSIHFSFDAFLVDGIIKPLICTTPIVLLIGLSFFNFFESQIYCFLLSFFSILFSLFLIWRLSLKHTEKTKLLSFLTIKS